MSRFGGGWRNTSIENLNRTNLATGWQAYLRVPGFTGGPFLSRSSRGESSPAITGWRCCLPIRSKYRSRGLGRVERARKDSGILPRTPRMRSSLEK